MALPPPTGTRWALLAAAGKPEPQPAPPLASQPPPTPPVPTKGVALSAHMKTKPSFEGESETKKILELSNSERKAFEELILRVQEALNNHEFSAAPKEVEPHIKVERLPQKASIWGVPLLKDERTDVKLLKFLKAWNFNVGESSTMLKNTVRWRREFNIDGPMHQLDLRDDLQKAVYVHGHDKEGHPVFYNEYGEFRNKELYMNTFADEDKRMSFVRRIIQMLERNIRKFDFSEVGISTFLMVVDLKNAPGPGKKEIHIACDQLLKLLQDNYPEFVEKQKCIISWEVRVLDWEVSFDAEYVPDYLDSYTVILHKKKKMVSSDEAVVSYCKFKVDEPGKIVLTVDNATSKWKRLMYRFNVKAFQIEGKCSRGS